MPIPEIAPNVVQDVWPWAALLLLGALHGINPGMGWLFAVALGMQRRERRAVWGALLPLAAGHAAAIVVVAVVVGMIGATVSLSHLRWVVAAFLLALGVSKLVRDRHPRWGGMTVGGRDVAVWSFLMASAHGAGLMVVPFLLKIVRPVASAVPQAHAHHMATSPVIGGVTTDHAGHAAAVLAGIPAVPSAGLAVALVHTAGYLLVTGAIAVIVYERLGLRLLGRAWFNVDRVWAGALILTAMVTPFLA
jgi:hypothetical protein